MDFYTKEVEQQYWRYKRKRIGYLKSLFIQVFAWVLFTGVMLYQQLVGFEDVVVGIHTATYKSSERMFYELPLFWLVLLLIQFVLYYAESLPFLSKWQDYLEQKEFERLKNTYEYQLKLKDEATSNCHY
ncbi:hypothetical protein [Myroides sp. WP-1]|uniref:hypothetical protein n=1 Tax=Myroides sp. WP-1 TaxID=2759944 RepID=UPI0015FE5B5C|nr:hypothetical protein [Myroides sp. WP-1]MBB1138915.1 hypothetical protein [Myroides sp. WP-1]